MSNNFRYNTYANEEKVLQGDLVIVRSFGKTRYILILRVDDEFRRVFCLEERGIVTLRYSIWADSLIELVQRLPEQA